MMALNLTGVGDFVSSSDVGIETCRIDSKPAEAESHRNPSARRGRLPCCGHRRLTLGHQISSKPSETRNRPILKRIR